MKLFRASGTRRPDLAEWTLLLTVMVTLGVTLALWYSSEKTRLIASEQERLRALSNMVVKDIAINLRAVDNAIAGLIRDRLGNGDSIDHEAVSRRLRALVEVMPGIRGLMVIDRKGTVISSVPADLTGRNFAQRAYFTAPRDGGEADMLYLAPPFRSIRKEVVTTAAHIIPGRGGFNGVVVAVLDPVYFSGLLHTAMYANDLSATVVHSSGGVFVAAGPATSTAPQLLATARVSPPGLRIDTSLSVVLRRDVAVVHTALNQQTLAFAGVYAALGLLSAALLRWHQVRRRRLAAIEERQRHERMLAEAVVASEARFRTLIEEAPVAVAMARAGRFIYTNRRYNMLHGYAANEDLTGLSWSAMIAPASSGGLQQELGQLATDDAIEQRFEAIALGKHDALIPVLKATTRVALADGPATLVFVQDISAQKSAESHLLDARDAAEAANRSKAEFLANMSHEIRTPLNAILGMAYLLERGNRDSAAAPMLHKIRVAGRSLLGIVNDVLDVSKIEAGAMVLEHSWFQLQDVIDIVATTMGMAAGDKAISLSIRPLPAGVASVKSDSMRLEQLLINLTSNAIKFTERGRVELAIEAGAVEDGMAQLRFSVTDTGIGIAAAEQAKVFAPFTQADSSITRRYGGSGLGLTICKQIVEMMGGRIGVHSEPGAGSTFWFTVRLPVRPAAATSSSPDMLGLDVLLAQADGEAQGTLPETAQALGWQIRNVASGAALLADLASREERDLPGVIILDWALAGADTGAIASAIRQGFPALSCPIVILLSTFQAGSRDGELARHLGDAMLTKPVTASTLYNAVIEARSKRTGQDDTAVPAAVGSNLLSGLRIMVVDDSEINRDVAQRVLREEGAEVCLAEDGRAAVDALVAEALIEGAQAVDLVLMDVQMPVMDGIEATRILRAMPRFRELPIVALTAGAFSAHKDAARAAGMNHFIAKPFDIPLMIDLIQRLTDRRGGADTVLAAPAGAGIIDLRRGAQIWGSTEVHQRYLRKFANGFGDTVQAMRSELAKGRPADAAALVHKLCGAAANVALSDVHAIAQQLASALARRDDAASTVPNLLDALDEAMQAALVRIDVLAPASSTAVSPSSATPAAAGAVLALDRARTEELAVCLGAMLTALEQNAPEPASLAAGRLAPYLPAAALAPILACIDDFDWPGAAHHTQALAAQLSPSTLEQAWRN